LARRVLAEVVEARLVDLEDHRGAVVRGDREVVDLADLDAGDLDVLALDDRERRVEDRPHLVGAAAAALRARAGQHEDRGAGQGEEDDREAPHGPGRIALGSQSRVPLVSRNGAELSALGCEAVPGQRRALPVVAPSGLKPGAFWV